MAVLRVLVLVASVAATLAASLPQSRSLPSGDVTCGDNTYTASELTAAINAGLDDLNSNNLQGWSY